MKHISPDKQAWELEYETLKNSCPPEGQAEDRSWELTQRLEEHQDGLVSMMWLSKVPGSGAPEHLMIAGVQALENRGFRVPGWREVAAAGMDALERGDMPELQRRTVQMRALWRIAERNPDSPCWAFRHYDTWEGLRADTAFPRPGSRPDGMDFLNRLHAGWLAQIIGGAHGTSLEGYTTDTIRRTFGEVRSYVYPPSTLNDDITFELAFLAALENRGAEVTSRDIGEEWVSRIPFGWSAELVALENLKTGLLPPESAEAGNPFTDWIGAQMRGAVCGLVAPADPEKAARLAWIDGRVSHADNGVLGEVFNALLVSLAFGETALAGDAIRRVMEAAAGMLPEKSEYRSVIDFSLACCRESTDWEAAWRVCEEKYKRYNWVHAYPNAAAEVVALWFGGGDFDETLHIVSMEGQDVDCNAAQIMTVIGVMGGMEVIPESWKTPIGDRLETYVRGMKSLGIRELAEWTAGLAEAGM